MNDLDAIRYSNQPDDYSSKIYPVKSIIKGNSFENSETSTMFLR